MDKYTKYGRIYPSIAGMVLPWILTVMCIGAALIGARSILIVATSLAGILVSTALVYAAIGYALQELFRETSKWLFQYPLFNESETKMPTTEILLWKNSLISKDYHKCVVEKVKDKFGISLFPEEDEKTDENEARLTIVNAVQQMREATRGDNILLQYNYEFGFCRNYLGAAIWGVVIMLIISAANIWLENISWGTCVVLLLLQVLSMLISFIALKKRGKAYAHSLLSTFMTL